METAIQPTCFISYSHDSDEHKDWVRGLAEQLQGSGIKTRLDQWDLRFGMNITQYMEENIANADYVLMVCTPGYANRANGAQGGVGWEKQIITGEMYYQISSETKFIPILRHNDQNVAIPRFLRGKYYADFSTGDTTLNFEGLLRHLYDSPQYVRPPLGDVPTFTGTIPTASSSPILPEIYELSDIAMKWNASHRPYHHVEELSKGLVGLIRNPPLDVVKAEEPLRSFLLLAGLHHGGNWLHWVGDSLGTTQAVATILTALGVSYERARFRAQYALQYFDPELVRQSLGKPQVRIGAPDRKIVEEYVLNGSVKTYLLEKAISAERGLAEKLRVVVGEIEQFGPDPAKSR